VLQSMQVVQRY